MKNLEQNTILHFSAYSIFRGCSSFKIKITVISNKCQQFKEHQDYSKSTLTQNP